MEATKKRKINTRQLTAIKATKNNGKRVFYFRYYWPDLQKDNVRKFANTEAEAKVLREQTEIIIRYLNFRFYSDISVNISISFIYSFTAFRELLPCDCPKTLFQKSSRSRRIKIDRPFKAESGVRCKTPFGPPRKTAISHNPTNWRADGSFKINSFDIPPSKA